MYMKGITKSWSSVDLEGQKPLASIFEELDQKPPASLDQRENQPSEERDSPIKSGPRMVIQKGLKAPKKH